MPTRSELDFLLAGEIVTLANNQLAKLEEPGLPDVYEYLLAQESAYSLLLQLQIDSQRRHNYLSEALSTWESDRSNILFQLLQLAKHAAEFKRFQTAESCVRCAKALVESPLIRAVNPKAYGDMRDHAALLLEEGNKNMNVRLINNAYFAGITYNCAAFVPEIFADRVTEGTIKTARGVYYQMLNVLQGRPAIMH